MGIRGLARLSCPAHVPAVFFLNGVADTWRPESKLHLTRHTELAQGRTCWIPAKHSTAKPAPDALRHQPGCAGCAIVPLRFTTRGDASLTLSGLTKPNCRSRRWAEQAPQPCRARVAIGQITLDGPLSKTAGWAFRMRQIGVATYLRTRVSGAEVVSRHARQPEHPPSLPMGETAFRPGSQS